MVYDPAFLFCFAYPLTPFSTSLLFWVECVCVCVCVCMHVCMCACMHACVCVRACVRACVRVCVHACMRMCDLHVCFSHKPLSIFTKFTLLLYSIAEGCVCARACMRACVCVHAPAWVSLKSFLFFIFSPFYGPSLPDILFMVNWALKAGQLSVYLDHLLFSSSTLHFNNKPINQKMTLSFSVPVPCRKKHCHGLDKMQRTMAALLRPTRGTDRAVWSRTCRSHKSHLKLCPLRKPWHRFENTHKCKLWSQNYFYFNHLSQTLAQRCELIWTVSCCMDLHRLKKQHFLKCVKVPSTYLYEWCKYIPSTSTTTTSHPTWGTTSRKTSS